MQATNTLQIRPANNLAEDSGLQIHADRGDGTPACGTVNRDWRRKLMQYVSLGSGRVTCQRCKA